MLFIVAQGPGKSPMDYCAEAEPMQVHGLTVASYGGALRYSVLLDFQDFGWIHLLTCIGACCSG